MINFYANDFGILLRSCAQKNYKNPSIFVKVTAKNSGTFFLGHGVGIAPNYDAIEQRSHA